MNPLDSLLLRTAEVFDLTPSQILSPTRRRRVAEARMAFCHAAAALELGAHVQIATAIRRDRSAVGHAIKATEARLSTEPASDFAARVARILANPGVPAGTRPAPCPPRVGVQEIEIRLPASGPGSFSRRARLSIAIAEPHPADAATTVVRAAFPGELAELADALRYLAAHEITIHTT